MARHLAHEPATTEDTPAGRPHWQRNPDPGARTAGWIVATTAEKANESERGRAAACRECRAARVRPRQCAQTRRRTVRRAPRAQENRSARTAVSAVVGVRRAGAAARPGTARARRRDETE